MANVVVFDIDGTLVDSVDLHAKAWQEALARFGKDVPYEVVRSQIGKGGDQLLPEFLDGDELERFGDELDDFRSNLFQRRYLPFAKPFPGARELLATLKQAGDSIGLASSASRIDLGYYLRMLGGASLIDAATSADDVDRSKPFPDVYEVVLERLGAEASAAIAVGDSPYDAQAAARVGLATVGVLSGGFPQHDLEEAGCVAIYQDPSDLLVRLSQSPLAPDPQPPHPR